MFDLFVYLKDVLTILMLVKLRQLLAGVSNVKLVMWYKMRGSPVKVNVTDNLFL